MAASSGRRAEGASWPKGSSRFLLGGRSKGLPRFLFEFEVFFRFLSEEIRREAVLFPVFFRREFEEFFFTFFRVKSGRCFLSRFLSFSLSFKRSLCIFLSSFFSLFLRGGGRNSCVFPFSTFKRSSRRFLSPPLLRSREFSHCSPRSQGGV